jgi:Transposase, Mutator family
LGRKLFIEALRRDLRAVEEKCSSDSRLRPSSWFKSLTRNLCATLASWRRCRVWRMPATTADVSSQLSTRPRSRKMMLKLPAQLHPAVDRLRPNWPRLSSFPDEADTDMTFPTTHRARLHSTNPLERLNGEIKRRTDASE